MAENLNLQPKRGILKQSSSFEQRDLEPPGHHKNPHFDEQNLLETLHPADKDYGFMKIDEPKTPYEYGSEGDDEDEESADKAAAASKEKEGGPGGEKEKDSKPGRDELDVELLAERIKECSSRPQRRKSEPSADEEDLRLLSPAERARRKSFEQKRKAHYNEFYAIKMARQLMEDDDEDQDADKAGGAEESSSKDEGEEDMEVARDET